MRFDRVGGREQRTGEVRDTVLKTLDTLRGQMNVLLTMAESNETQSPAAQLQLPKEVIARMIFRERRRRDLFFNPNLFGEPAWDMLLELYATKLKQQSTTVTRLCNSSGVPTTTALRWIEHLENEGLVFRKKDPLDGRRIFLELTETGADSVSRYFDEINLS